MRSSLIFLLVLAFVLTLAKREEQHAARAGNADWPQFRGNHELTGVPGSALPETLNLLWSYEAGDSIESSAAIVNGTVFVGSRSGKLVALDLGNGKVRWKYDAGQPIGESSASVRNGLVTVGDLSGTLHGVSAEDGRRVWAFKTNGEIKSSPVIIDGKVLVGSYDEHLYSVSARSGQLIWKLRTNGPLHCTPAVSGGLTFISGCDEVFRGVRIADGKEIFQIPSGGYTGASPALMAQTAFFGTFRNEVLAVDLGLRRIVWRYQHPQRQFPFYSSAAVVDGKVAGGRVVIGGRDKMVHCLDAKTGKGIWTFATRGRVESSPAIAGGRVYVGSHDGRLYVLDLKTGAKLWEFNAGAPLSASPAIGSGRLVVGSQDGVLYCFG